MDFIIVSKLRTDIIKKAIQAFIDEKDQAYWLKLYHIGIALDIRSLDIRYKRFQLIFILEGFKSLSGKIKIYLPSELFSISP